MAKAFVKEFNKKFNKNVKGFSPDAIDIINSYQWKGNVRELRNVIERIILLESGDLITRETLSFLKTSPGQPGTPVKAAAELSDGQHYLQIAKNGVSMGNVLRDLIIQTLNITNGNQIKAAKLLGISRAKLRYRIEQLGINITGKNIT